MIGRIYKLIDPITNKVRYIGQTTLTIEKRLYHHWRDREQQKNKNNHKANWICKLFQDYNKKPIVELIEEILNCTDEILNEKERYWINYYKSLGYDLTNTSGKEYFRIYKKNRTTNAKKIYCYDTNYNLQIFESARKASKILNIDYKIISYNAKGKFSKGFFVFSFVELSQEEIKLKFTPKIITGLKVKSIDKYTEEVKIFKNQIEASKYFNCNFRNINFVLKGKRNYCANQKWEYIK